MKRESKKPEVLAGSPAPSTSRGDENPEKSRREWEAFFERIARMEGK